MVLTVAFGVLVLIGALLAFAATRPGSMHVERSARIKAPAESIFPLISDFHRWEAWSPYEKLDPAMKKTFSGAASGTGAVYEWQGNNKAGQGRMEMTAVSTPSQVTIRLDFMKPFEAHNVAQFTLAPDGDATN